MPASRSLSGKAGCATKAWGVSGHGYHRRARCRK